MTHRDSTSGPSSPELTRIVLRPIGSPLPLTFLVLAAGTFFLSVDQLDLLLDEAELRTLGLALVSFAFPLHLLAAVFGFLARDPVGALASGVMGSTWLLAGLALLVDPVGDPSPAVGLVFAAAAVLLAVPAISAWATKVVPALVIGAVAVRFAIAAVYELTDTEPVELIAGWFGLAVAIAAVYVGLALALEDAKRRTVLPLGRHAEGRKAFERPIEEQVREAEHDAGVRRQL